MKIFRQLISILTIGMLLCMSGCTAEQSLEEDTILGTQMPTESQNPEATNPVQTKQPSQTDVPSATKTPTDNVAPTDGSRVIENEFIAVTVGNKWTVVPAEVVTNSITLIKSESESISVLPVPLAPGQEGITVEEYKPIVQETLALQPQLQVSKIEVQDRNIGKVIYYEGKIDLTPEEVTSLVSGGTYAKSIVDEYGGPTGFAQAVNMSQVAMYYIKDGKCVAITGQATNGADISDTKTEMESMINTVVFK